MSVELIVEALPSLSDRFVQVVERIYQPVAGPERRFSCAISGGSVATTMLPKLAKTGIDWTRTEVFFADERAVPPDDRDSNYRVARTLLLDRVPVPPGQVHRMPGEAGDLTAAARDYGFVLERVLGSPPRIDLVLLGVGADGHVASLFAGRQAIVARDGWVAAVVDAPKPPVRRLTLTLPTLAEAGTLVFGVFGSEKAPAVHDALQNPESTLPFALALRRARHAIVLLDPDAAVLLSPGDPPLARLHHPPRPSHPGS